MTNDQTYTIRFRNDSDTRGSSCVYVGPAENVRGKLAWFASPARTARFQWTIRYDFVWAETGVLRPGVVFEPGEVLPADLTEGSKVTFTKAGGEYRFKDQAPLGRPGDLLIQTDHTIPQGFTAVGIGMSGAATQAVQAGPDHSFQFTVPTPTYSIAVGNYEQGQLLGEAPSNAATIVFPANIFIMEATLNPDSTWTIRPADS